MPSSDVSLVLKELTISDATEGFKGFLDLPDELILHVLEVGELGIMEGLALSQVCLDSALQPGS